MFEISFEQDGFVGSTIRFGVHGLEIWEYVQFR